MPRSKRCTRQSVRDKLTAFGAEIVSDQDSTPQHLGDLVKSEIAKWAAPIKAARRQRRIAQSVEAV